VISEDRKLKEYLMKNAKKAATDLQNPSSSQVSLGTISGSVPGSKFKENVTTKDLPGVSSSKEIADNCLEAAFVSDMYMLPWLYMCDTLYIHVAMVIYV
jgi:hypothetical protein